MHYNSKRWLANYLSGRRAHVNFKGIPSKMTPFRDRVPQGSALSPKLLNLFLHDIPTPTSQDTKILSYMTTSLSHPPILNMTQLLQTSNITKTHYKCSSLPNRLRLAPEKSTANCNKNQKHNHNNSTPVTLCNTPISYTNKVKILRVPYNNGLTFKEHIAYIKQKCIP